MSTKKTKKHHKTADEKNTGLNIKRYDVTGHGTKQIRVRSIYYAQDRKDWVPVVMVYGIGKDRQLVQLSGAARYSLTNAFFETKNGELKEELANVKDMAAMIWLATNGFSTFREDE